MKRTNNKGFTLIELMATVAIIGVLAAIAIPNYIKYQRKARQAEAKVMLGSAYLAEATESQDQHTYSGCLTSLGFATDASANYYSVGFASGQATAGGCLPYNGTATSGFTAKCNYYSWKAILTTTPATYTGVASCTGATGTGGAVAATVYDPGGSISALADINVNAAATASAVTWNTFTIGAVGAIGGTAYDGWAIDNTKQIYQTQDGVN